MKKYDIGGPIKYSESGSAGGSGVSFGEAFKAARKQGLDEFTWRGKKYTTELKSSKKSDEPTEAKKTEAPAESPAVSTSAGPRSGGRGSKPGSAKVGTGRYDDPSSSYMDRVLSPFKRLTGGDLFGQRKVERVAKGAGVSTEEARRRVREAGMSGGGSVKKMAGGGMARSSASKRADGIAQRGKTKGRMV